MYLKKGSYVELEVSMKSLEADCPPDARRWFAAAPAAANRSSPRNPCGAAPCNSMSRVSVTFEESADDIKKNVASLGFDIEDLVARKKLIIDHVRVERSEIEENGEYDLEGLFIRLDYAIKQVGAKRVMLDTIETLFSGLDEPGHFAL